MTEAENEMWLNYGIAPSASSGGGAIDPVTGLYDPYPGAGDKQPASTAPTPQMLSQKLLQGNDPSAWANSYNDWGQVWPGTDDPVTQQQKYNADTAIFGAYAGQKDSILQILKQEGAAAGIPNNSDQFWMKLLTDAAFNHAKQFNSTYNFDSDFTSPIRTALSAAGLGQVAETKYGPGSQFHTQYADLGHQMQGASDRADLAGFGSVAALALGGYLGGTGGASAGVTDAAGNAIYEGLGGLTTGATPAAGAALAAPAAAVPVGASTGALTPSADLGAFNAAGAPAANAGLGTVEGALGAGAGGSGALSDVAAQEAALASYTPESAASAWEAAQASGAATGAGSLDAPASATTTPTMPPAVPELATNNAVPGAVTASSGLDNAVTAGAAGTSGALSAADAAALLQTLPPATKTAMEALGLGSASEALDKLMKLGLPIATIAGLFEEPNNPLLGPIVDAAQKAIGKADEFAAYGPIGLTPAQQQAIDLAKQNVGSYKPYLERAGALADQAAGGITQEQIDRYQNPYLRGVLDPAIRDIEEAAARRREQLKAVTSMSGNDLRTPSTDPNRFNVEDSLLDRETLRTIGDLSGKTYADSFNTATGLAGKDLDRSLSSSNIYGGLGKAEGALGAADVAGLTSAGALERLPQEDARSQLANSSKLYTDVVHGNQGALDNAAQPSTLTNITGALGALKTAKDLELY